MGPGERLVLSPRSPSADAGVSRRISVATDAAASGSCLCSPPSLTPSQLSARRTPTFAGRTWMSDGVRAALCHTPKLLMRSASLPARDVRGGAFCSTLTRSARRSTTDLLSPGGSAASFRLFDGEGGSQASSPKSYRSSLCRSATAAELPSYARSTESWESKLGRPLASDCTSYPSRSTTAASSSWATASCSASQDHMWRELSHDDIRDAQKDSRLVGDEAKAIGRRGRESKGIPWRQIPSFSRTGHLSETGDPHINSDVIRRVNHLQKFKGKSPFSPRLSQGSGASACLGSDAGDAGQPYSSRMRHHAEAAGVSPPPSNRRGSRSPSPSWLVPSLDADSDQVPRSMRRMSSTKRTRDTCPFGIDGPPVVCDARSPRRASPSPLPYRPVAPTSSASPRGGRCTRLDTELRRISIGTQLEPGHRFSLFEVDSHSARRSPSPFTHRSCRRQSPQQR
mmetsp:Transcript_11553/g.26866  ORF Transcript_11553/g.26866 Transcript_11553/m.26866 type:complete len:454 (-) Transcript_11553:112-1473(-)